MELISFEQWISNKCGISHPPVQAAVRQYQMQKMREIARYASQHSRFYRELYRGYDLDQPQKLPLISSADIVEQGSAMVCMSQTKIKRIVSMTTSGSTGKPKRIYFSPADLELTMDFFAHGMLYLTGPQQKVMIFMDGATEDSLGDLLARGLRRIGSLPLVHGYVRDQQQAVAELREFSPQCIVGVPKQVLALAESLPELRPEKVLLSADNIPPELRQRVGELWQCQVFAHWGMRETGLGGAVECPEHQGQHIRHADLLLEIIDPDSGELLPEGEQGEIVVSTLNREAMPLLRYRTGDISYLISEPCACGSELSRLGEVGGHKIWEEQR